MPNEKLLTKQEEITLGTWVQRWIKERSTRACNSYTRRKGREAREKLILSNLRLVQKVAHRYKNNGLDLEDLISEGNFGLIKAAHRFDHTKGFKFISYAVWWIRQSILQALCESSRTIRIPVNIIAENQKIKKANEAATGLEEVPLIDIPTTSSYHNVMGEDGEFLDIIEDLNSPSPDFELMTKEQLETCVRKCTSILSERERDIIFKYFGLTGSKWTLEAIAETLNLTRDRVRQIKENSIKKLRLKYQTS